MAFESNKSNKRDSLYLWIIVFFCVLTSDTLLFQLTEIRTHKTVQEYLVIFFGLTMLISYTMKQQFRFSYKFLSYAVLPITLIMLSMLINTDLSGGYFVKIGLVLFSYFITSNIRLIDFSRMYIKLMTFISVFSLITYSLYDVISKYANTLPVVGVYDRFIYLIFAAVPLNSYHRIRNWGPFWEPGVFQAYLIIAVILILFVHKKQNNFQLGVIITAIISTLSTTGYIALAIVFLAYLFQINSKSEVKKLGLIFGIGVLSIVFLSYSEDIFSRIFDKLLFENSDRSFELRIQAIYYNLIIFLENPLFGTGIMDRMNVFLQMGISDGITGMPDTNTTFQMLAVFGIGLSSIFILLQWKFVRLITTNFTSRTMIFIVIMIILNTEPLMFSIFFNMLFYWGVHPKYDENGSSP